MHLTTPKCTCYWYRALTAHAPLLLCGRAAFLQGRLHGTVSHSLHVRVKARGMTMDSVCRPVLLLGSPSGRKT
jgi:hypothetical protein